MSHPGYKVRRCGVFRERLRQLVILEKIELNDELAGDCHRRAVDYFVEIGGCSASAALSVRLTGLFHEIGAELYVATQSQC